MSRLHIPIAVIRGDGIGPETIDSAICVLEAAREAAGGFELTYQEILAGAGYYAKHGRDVEPGGEERAGEAEAIFLGAIGLPSVRHDDGTEISPHLRLRDRFQLYAGVRPVKAYPNTPLPLSDRRAADIDLVILRESTEGLFYSAAVHGRSRSLDDSWVEDTLRITRETSEKLHRFGFQLARKRKAHGRRGLITCVDKSNVFSSMAFFRRIFDEVSRSYPDVEKGYSYVDAQALDLIRKPWDSDVLVTENMFGDILSDMAGGLVGGMGLAACAEIGDRTGLFQPAHGSAPDIIGANRTNPLAAVLSGALMLEYLAEKHHSDSLGDAAGRIENAVHRGFAENRLRPFELGGNMGAREITRVLMDLIRGEGH